MSKELIHERAYIWGEDGTMYLTHQYDTTFDVKRIVVMMGRLMRSKGDLFSVSRTHGWDTVQSTDLGEDLLLCIRSNFQAIDEQFPQHRQSPLFTLFKRFFRPFSFTSGRLWPEIVPYINEAVGKVRAFAKGSAIGGRIKLLARCERSNAATSKKLLTALRKTYSKLLTIRLDLGYYSNYCPGVGYRGQVMTLEEAQEHRDKLLARIRKGPGSSHLAGYMWKLEYGLEKGYHFHLAIFYDGQKASHDIVRGDELGRYWKEDITGGKGMFYNCNRNKADYVRCGIGTIARSDDQKWSALHDALRYLTKVDLYLRFRVDGRSRTFGTGGPYKRVRGAKTFQAGLGRPLAPTL